MIKYLNPIRISIWICILGLIVALSVFRLNKPEIKPPKLRPSYEAVFNTGIPVYFIGDRASLGKCEALNAKFMVYDTLALLHFEGKPALIYKVIGIDHKNGLHLLRHDSTEIVVYQVTDSTSNGKHDIDLLFRQPDGSFLLLPGSKCPF